MDANGSSKSNTFRSEFSLFEIVEMENIYKTEGQKCLGKEFCRKLAASLSSSANRAGKAALTWQQVQSWFQDKQQEVLSEEADSDDDLKLIDLLHASNPTKVEEPQEPEGYVEDIQELAFEARSYKDQAWYDVASFLTYRILSTGELEARVRFAGFAKDQDEWVNVRRNIRERSTPLEPSECRRVSVGDLVLCFRKRYELEVYVDARIVDIQREEHDASHCSCIFLVRYDYDLVEEGVELERICCRPRQETHPQPGARTQSPVGSLPTADNHPTNTFCISAQSLWD